MYGSLHYIGSILTAFRESSQLNYFGIVTTMYDAKGKFIIEIKLKLHKLIHLPFRVAGLKPGTSFMFWLHC